MYQGILIKLSADFQRNFVGQKIMGKYNQGADRKIKKKQNPGNQEYSIWQNCPSELKAR